MSSVTVAAYTPEMFQKWSEKELTDLDVALNEALKTEQKTVSMGAVMTGGARVTQRQREKNDYYGTPPEATEALMRHWCPSGDIWEPCAGKGMLSDVVQKFKPNDKIHLTDLNPQRDDIIRADFLTTASAPASDLTIITNPPFKYAAEFIKKGFELGVQKQAMLLKSTFFHAASRAGLFRQHRPSQVLALTWRLDFMNLGRPVMECIWVVFDSPCAARTDYDILEKPV